MTAFLRSGSTHLVPADQSVVIFGGVLALAVGAGYGALEWSLYRRYRLWFRDWRFHFRGANSASPSRLPCAGPSGVTENPSDGGVSVYYPDGRPGFIQGRFQWPSGSGRTPAANFATATSGRPSP